MSPAPGFHARTVTLTPKGISVLDGTFRGPHTDPCRIAQIVWVPIVRISMRADRPAK